ALADRLDVPVQRVRVSIEHRRGPGEWARRRRPEARPGHRGPPPGEQAGGAAQPDDGREGRGPGAGPGGFDPFSDRLSFAPFVASLQLPDGRWATVERPHDLLSPWQARLLMTLLISLLLLAPLVWWFARRLTRPIRAFAAAAERLGTDPEAPQLAPTGPAEVRTAITTFNAMQTGLKDHMRQRSQTIAAIAHDLRTPLTRLRFRAEQAPEHVRDRMAADIEEMDALIGQAMAYVRGQAAPERREAFDLARLAAECVDRFAETGADVVFIGHDPLPVLADPDALQRALDNLIGNALRYAGAARVVAYAEDGEALICVEDKGPGLPEEDLERVFEPFFRGERSRNRDTGGVGLGLAVARQAARAGGGVVARLTLPLTS
ncbi:MAG: HAMP domain-containing protein, partial [Brevundimonas sp.]